MGDPLAIFDIGLPSQDVFDVLRIRKDYIKVILKHVEDELPIYACTLHSHCAHTVFLKPFLQLLEIISHH
jgi:hypothetical protein